MRVILTNNVTDNPGGFLVRLVEIVAQFAHGMQHTAMDRFQTVADIR